MKLAKDYNSVMGRSAEIMRESLGLDFNDFESGSVAFDYEGLMKATGYTIDDVLVHDAHCKDNTLHMMLAMMSGDMPVALGIIRDVEAPTYDESVHQQLEEVQAKMPSRTLNEFLMSGETWEIK